MTKKSVSKLEATEVEISSAAGSVEAPKRRGRPPKKASTASAKTVAKRRGRPAKKVPAPVVDAADRPRRGRPVSVDALKARLARTRDALTAEKVKHRKQSLEMKQKLAEANAAKKNKPSMQHAKQIRFRRNFLRDSGESVASIPSTESIHLKQNSAFFLIDGMLWIAAKASSRSL